MLKAFFVVGMVSLFQPFPNAVLDINLAQAADFTVTITDPDQLAGITHAREQYNLANPEGFKETNQDYMSWVMTEAVKSYALGAKLAPLDAARAKCVASGDCTDAEKVGQ